MLAVACTLLIIASIVERTNRAPNGCFLNQSYPLHLTFDDGPEINGTTEDIVTTLAEEQIPATFFIMGSLLVPGTPRIRPQPKPLTGYEKYVIDQAPNQKATLAEVKNRYELLNKMKEFGFLIGSHTFFHRLHNFIITDPNQQATLDQNPAQKVLYFKSKEEMIENIRKGTSVLEEYLSKPIPFIRMPFGGGTLARNSKDNDHLNNADVVRAFASKGFRHIGWDIDSIDYHFSNLDIDPKTNKPTTAGDRSTLLMKNLSQEVCRAKGGIILLHDKMPLTALYLKQWIRELRAAGHRFVSLKELYPDCFDESTDRFSTEHIEFMENRKGELRQCWTRVEK